MNNVQIQNAYGQFYEENPFVKALTCIPGVGSFIQFPCIISLNDKLEESGISQQKKIILLTLKRQYFEFGILRDICSIATAVYFLVMGMFPLIGIVISLAYYATILGYNIYCLVSAHRELAAAKT